MTIRIATPRALREAAALPPALSLRRVFWIVLAGHLFFVLLVWIFGGHGGGNGRQVSTLSSGEPAELNSIVPERKASPLPRSAAPTKAAAAVRGPSRIRPTAAVALPTPSPARKPVKKAGAAPDARETPPKKLVTRAIPRPASTRSGER